MPRRPWFLLAAFVAWTAYLWVTRIANAWGSDTETTGGKFVSTVLAGIMLVLAAAVLVVLVRAWRRPLTFAGARLVQVLCGVTVVVWIVRGVQIVASDHDAPFKIVHVTLGVISLVLAALAWRVVAPVAGRRAPGTARSGSDDPDHALAGLADGRQG